jgi:hypothetical protein
MGAKARMIEHEGQSSIGRDEEKSVDPAGPSGEDTSPIHIPTSLVGAASSFAASMARFVASGFKMVEQSLYDLRMDHCQVCAYRRESQCSLCRCFVAKKAWLPHEDCPVERWES